MVDPVLTERTIFLHHEWRVTITRSDSGDNCFIVFFSLGGANNVNCIPVTSIPLSYADASGITFSIEADEVAFNMPTTDPPAVPWTPAYYVFSCGGSAAAGKK